MVMLPFTFDEKKISIVSKSLKIICSSLYCRITRKYYCDRFWLFSGVPGKKITYSKLEITTCLLI